MDNKPHKYLYNFLSGGAWACGFGLTVVVLLLILFLSCDYSLLEDYILIENSLGPIEENALELLINKNKIVSASDIISHITSFYSTIITVMSIIIGLVGILGYIHIRVLTYDGLEKYKEEAKSNAATELKNYLEKKEFMTLSKNM